LKEFKIASEESKLAISEMQQQMKALMNWKNEQQLKEKEK